MAYNDIILQKLYEKFEEFGVAFQEAIDKAKESGAKMSPPDWLDFDKQLANLYKVVPYIVNCGLIDDEEEWKQFQEEMLPKCKTWVKMLDQPEVKPTKKEMSMWMFKTITDPKMLEQLGKSLHLIVDGVEISEVEPPAPKGEKASEEDWN